MKLAHMTPHVMTLVAGDFSLHSQVIVDARKLLQNSPDKTPENVARLYGRSIQNLKQRQAEDLYLAPLGMNSDTFIAQQKDMSDNFIDRITNQLQSYQGDDVEALVMGSDGENAHLYTVDTRGIAHYMNDIGFAAIGSGAWHAKSRLMQGGYVNTANLAQALASTYAAKRTADVAPGVGRYTDIWLVLKDSMFPLWDDVESTLKDLYDQYEVDRRALGVAAIARLQESLNEAGRKATAAAASVGNPSSHGSSAAPAAETTSRNEAGASAPDSQKEN
jgi:hypothetical protein